MGSDIYLLGLGNRKIKNPGGFASRVFLWDPYGTRTSLSSLGEIRGVSKTETRPKKAVKLDFSRALVSQESLKSQKAKIDLELLRASSVSDLLEILFM
jgi:hypothetical protein